MNVILCHPEDQDAIWLYLALKKQNVRVELISPEELLMAEVWKQTINEDENNFYIKTKKGVEISNKSLTFLFNRVQMPKAPIWDKAAKVEKEYIYAEMNALLMSWLYQVQQICPVYNPTNGYSLSGVFWSKEQWSKAAFKAGFQNVVNTTNEIGNTKKVLVVGKKIIANCYNNKLIDSCIKLSQAAQTPLLEVIVDENEYSFFGANAFPSISQYGDKLVALIKYIINENEANLALRDS